MDILDATNEAVKAAKAVFESEGIKVEGLCIHGAFYGEKNDPFVYRIASSPSEALDQYLTNHIIDGMVITSQNMLNKEKEARKDV